MVPFGGWEMPLAYPSGTVAEHRACRSSAVAFDVSHLGTVRVSGPDAFEHLQRSFSNDLRRVHPGRAQYTHLLDEDGFVVDDIIVWWVDEERFDVMPNASNTSDVLGAIGGGDVTEERAVIAVQGPEARDRLAEVSPAAAAVHRFNVERFEWRGVTCLVAGTGYTGEDGVECAVPAEVAPGFWEAVLAPGRRPGRAGRPRHAAPRGGAAPARPRARPGHHPAPGRAGLGRRLGQGPNSPGGPRSRRSGRTARPGACAGFVADGRQPLRDGAEMCHGQERVGILTSGNFSPMRERGIGLGFVDADARLLDGDAVTVLQRGRELTARLVRPPLWPVREESE